MNGTRARQGRRECCHGLPAAKWSDCLLVRMEPSRTCLFRFLLEASENLANFTVLDRRATLLKLVFSPHQRREVMAALREIGTVLPLEILPWPVSGVCPDVPSR